MDKLFHPSALDAANRALQIWPSKSGMSLFHINPQFSVALLQH
jgi:hypothetical protein